MKCNKGNTMQIPKSFFKTREETMKIFTWLLTVSSCLFLFNWLLLRLGSRRLFSKYCFEPDAAEEVAVEPGTEEDQNKGLDNVRAAAVQ